MEENITQRVISLQRKLIKLQERVIIHQKELIELLKSKPKSKKSK